MNAIEFDALPFFWRVRDRADETNIVRDHMPFAFDERPDLGRLCQRTRPDVVRSREEVYRAMNAGEPPFDGSALRWIEKLRTVDRA